VSHRPDKRLARWRGSRWSSRTNSNKDDVLVLRHGLEGLSKLESCVDGLQASDTKEWVLVIGSSRGGAVLMFIFRLSLHALFILQDPVQ
jgi:hypothetical protein